METKKRLKKIPEGCIEIPLEEVDYIYQPPHSHTSVITMKQNKNKFSQSHKQLGNKNNFEWKDGDILTTMDKNGLTHNFILNDMANLGKQDEKEKEELNLKLREALKKDFKELYVKEYTIGWKEQRFLRNIELNIMSLENTKKYINGLILTKLFKKKE